MIDLHRKKAFLQQGSALYQDMIELTASDTIKRYLAFRVIVNAMAFEDLVNDRRDKTMRKFRDTLLAHKQEPEFFQGFHAVDHITRSKIGGLLQFMRTNTEKFVHQLKPLERRDVTVERSFKTLIIQVLDQYEREELAGFRISNNFFAYTGNQIHEISPNSLAGVFYRYNSSKALSTLSQSIYNNTYQYDVFAAPTRHAKLDMILHAQNMADCAIRDTQNPHSIDGLLEVCITESIGDPTALKALAADVQHQKAYRNIRKLRNKFIAHMDANATLSSMLEQLDALPIDRVYEFVNRVDKAVYDVTMSDSSKILSRYKLANEPLPDITDIDGLQPKPYDS